MPKEWHLAQVAEIYKKGDPSQPENYRPISLLNIAYKVYAVFLLNRLKRAGAEARLWPSQYGFRSKRSTTDALFTVRRKMEQAWAWRNGRLHVLALDWRKAFDCISPEGLFQALSRFGIPRDMIDAIQDIYTDREFSVTDCGRTSMKKAQCAGISQGCPLSPFLFGIVMTAVMTDAKALLKDKALEAYGRDDLADILFADDTLLLGVSAKHVEEYAKAIQTTGREYGLEQHWGKVQLISIRSDETLCQPDGKEVKPRDSMVYLGGLLHENGRAASEFSRRIGMCRGLFKKLTQVWSCARLSTQRRIEVFNALILSKLKYGLSTLWMGTAEQRRLDGFHAYCLRRILGIQAAFISRVSHAKVFEKAAQERVTKQLLKQQLLYFGKIARMGEDSVLRRSAFHHGLMPCTAFYVRKAGRPRKTWTEQLVAEATKLAGSHARLQTLLQDEATWSNFVSNVP